MKWSLSDTCSIRGMRIPLVITGTTFLVMLAWGYRDHRRLGDLREQHARLKEQAALMGYSLDEEGSPERLAKLPRGNRVEDAKRVAAGFIAYGVEMEALANALESPDEATRQRIIDQMDRLLGLDARQLEILIAEILQAPGLTETRKTYLVRFALEQLTKNDPRRALVMLTGSSALEELLAGASTGIKNTLVYQALRGWAELDPEAALEWFRSQAGQDGGGYPFPALIQGGAVTDPRLMLQAIVESGQDPQLLVPMLIRGRVGTMEDRLAGLSLLREWSATCDDARIRVKVSGDCLYDLALGPRGYSETFSRASAWIDRAGLSEQEMDLVLPQLGNGIKLKETGLWIDWLGRTLPPEKSGAHIENLFRAWTGLDQQAAARWLDAAPENGTKHAALLAYAKVVASKDTREAARRALAVPESPARDEALKVIHQHCPKEAADAFAKEHGIEE